MIKNYYFMLTCSYLRIHYYSEYVLWNIIKDRKFTKFLRYYIYKKHYAVWRVEYLNKFIVIFLYWNDLKLVKLEIEDAESIKKNPDTFKYMTSNLNDRDIVFIWIPIFFIKLSCFDRFADRFDNMSIILTSTSVLWTLFISTSQN